MLDKEGNDGYWTGSSGRAPSNSNLEELTIWFDCWRESLPSLPESSHLKNDIIRNRILLLKKLINQAIIEYNHNSPSIQIKVQIE